MTTQPPPTPPVLKWDEMSAVQKNAAVAEHVMGWKWTPPKVKLGMRWRDDMFWRIPGTDIPASGVEEMEVTLSGDYDFCVTPQGCALVIEAMRAKGKSVVIENALSGKWKATFLAVNVNAIAGSMPEAVAIASLRAAGIEVVTEGREG